MNGDRLPIILLTGFLGSGKTTLLNSWLRTEALRGAAVVVNEFGEVGIDHALIASSNDNTIELTTGCLCCTVQGDLVNTLRELTLKRAQGRVSHFDRVVIETTGLADPGPILQALMTAPVAGRYRLQHVTTVVDAILGANTFERYWEARKQVAIADNIVVTKTDLAGGFSDVLAGQLRALNPAANVRASSAQAIPSPDTFAGVDVYQPAVHSADVARWLNANAYSDDRRPHDEPHDHREAHRHSQITSFCLEYTEPLDWKHIAHWLDALVIAHGDNLLRVKGVLDIAGRDAPIVVQVVQHLFHPPFMLQAWGTDRHRSQIVFITRGIARDYVAEVLDTIRRC